jgi:hypothetical protein
VAVESVCAGVVFHKYVYIPEPPVAVTVAVPFGCPHVSFVDEIVTVGTGFIVIVILAVPVHPAVVPVTV